MAVSERPLVPEEQVLSRCQPWRPTLNVGGLEHLSRSLIHLLFTPQFFKSFYQVTGSQTPLLGPTEVVNDLSTMHHQQAAPKAGSLVH